MKTKVILTAAKALICQPEYWCKGTFHEDGERFCAVGAINTIANGKSTAETNASLYAWRALEKQTKKLGYAGPAQYNDSPPNHPRGHHGTV